MALPSGGSRKSTRTPSLFGGGPPDDLFQDVEDTFFKGYTGLSALSEEAEVDVEIE